MKRTPTHLSIPSIAATFVAAVVVLVSGFTTSLADKATKVPVRQDASSTSSPFGAALRKTISTMEKNSRTPVKTISNTPSKIQNGSDTSNRETRILSVRTTSDVITVKLELAEEDNSLNIGVYNMLGKKVMDVFHGPSSKGPHDFSNSISDLPEGVYICIAEGNGFRKAEKFYRSR